ncbi:unnamed protein product [Callosobruchus maculatus]|uniref:C2H2-type domain-containing protein n=1 Tax=Callosobruchus maculatus TaxID=64391 RepID=A0A653CYD0_CALMS|nr:unnamed protein product [Callosobruchus maculatus]
MNFTFFEEDFLFFASHNYCTIYGLRRFITLRTQITMEDEMVANVQNMKIEVEEVKVEMAEVNSESFGIEQNSCGLVVEDDHDERTDRIIDLQRIKEEHNYVKTRSNKEVLEMQGKKIKVEESWEDPKPFDPIYITEEDTFKVEQNDVLIDGNAKTALNSGPQQEIQRQNPEVCKKPRDELYSCYNCNYSTFYKYHLIKHMKLHCNTKFVSKKKLDNHAVRKHPNFIEPISSKIQECSQCTFATAQKSTLDKHMLKHSETKDELKMCMDCDRVFKNERWLVNHRIKQHSDSIQVFKCIHCTYKTTLNSSFDRHMLKHLGTTDDHMAASDLYDCKHCTYKTSLKTNFKRHKLKHFKRENRYRCVCAHCGLTLISLRYRDEHVVRKHPDSIASITRKIYKCKYCSYKTTLNQRLSNHILKHPETVDSSKLHNCTHCGASFKSKKSIDEHMVKRHPDFIASVSSKIHVCKYCTYKSTVSYRFAKHMLKHSGAVRHKYRKCTQCGAAFTSKAGLDDHTIRKHPDFIGSISRKIHACILCSYKTTLKSTLTRHTRQHYPEIRRNFKLNSCSHCTATFASKQNLNEHALQKHPYVNSTVTSKIHKCTFCPYKTTIKYNIDKHMMSKQHSQESQVTVISTNTRKLKRCNHCDAVFKRRENLDNHIVMKHPDFAASVSRKIHACKYCTYKTTMKYRITKHERKHTLNHIKAPKAHRLTHKSGQCTRCGAAFKSKRGLDDHTIRKHPDLIGFITCKIHVCTLCPYKTTLKCNLTEHMLQHYPKTCSHCKATFKSKLGLDDHTLREHPHVTSTVTSKIYKCILCPYETAIKYNIDNHMSKQHSQESQVTSTNTRKLKMCNHCDAVFKRRENLDNHIVMKHPDFAASVSCKIHACKYCTYKTAISYHITKHERKHMLNHLKAPKAHRLKHKSGKCTQCGAAFKSKAGLDEHTIRKHPDFIGFITCKILVCTLCSYKTTFKASLTRHMSKHSETQESPKPLSSCSQCKVTFKSKQSLDKHICGASVNIIVFHQNKKVFQRKMYYRRFFYCTILYLFITMEDEMAAIVQNMKIEVEEVKVEVAEVNIESFGIEQNSWRLAVEEEHNYVKAKSNMEIFEMQGEKIKVEENWEDCKPFEPMYITEEDIFKLEKNDDLIDGNAKIALNSGLQQEIQRQNPEVCEIPRDGLYSCYNYNYSTFYKYHLIKHMKLHCNTKFASKEKLDNHAVRKHPDFIEPISSKIQECSQCTFATAQKATLDKHMLKHSETKDELKMCMDCDRVFKNERWLVNHIIKEHSDSIQVFKCIHCTYKTNLKSSFDRHMFKHLGTTDDHMAASDLYDCKHCTYKTSLKTNFKRHKLKHSKRANRYRCITMEDEMAAIVQNMKIEVEEVKMEMAEVDIEITEEHNYVKAKSNMEVFEMQGEKIKVEENWEDCKSFEPMYITEEDLFKLEKNDDLIDGTAIIALNSGPQQEIQRQNPEVCKKPRDELYSCYNCNYSTFYKYHLIKHMKLHCSTKFASKKNLDNHAITMEAEMAAIVQNMKIEVEEVKMEMAEVDFESFGIEQNSWRLSVEEEHNYVKAKSNMEDFEVQGEKIKVEENWEDCKSFEPMYITEEDLFKLEKNDDLIDGTAIIALNSGPQQEIQRHNPEVCKKPRDELYSCYNCNYSTFYKYHLIKHMKLHCSTKFASKKKLDNHAVTKHPDFIGSLSCKMHLQQDFRQQITMENEMVANIQNMKIEVEGVKVEMAEVDIESFGIEQNSWRLAVEGDHDETTDRIIDLHRIKEEHNYVKTRSNMEVLEQQDEKIKVEEDLKDYKPFEPMYFTEEDTFKLEKNDDSVEGNLNKALNSGPQQEIQRQNLEVCRKSREELYSCYNCNYTTFYKYHLIKHMKLHCNTKFASKKKLDNHTIKKHLDFIESISSKIREWSQCTFATAPKSTLDKHMLEHSETKDELKMCTNDHMAAPISRDWYDCKHCTYKTSLKTNFKRHMLKHSKRANRYRSVCAHCGLTLISLRYRDEHVVRKHPDSIASITRRIYECKHCSYKTTLNQRLSNHIIKHPETVDSSKLHNCIHCGASFKSKIRIDEHTIKKHPDFIASVSSKIHACKYCTYKSVITNCFDQHMLKHSGATVRHRYRKCTLCGAAFKSEACLDEHTIRKHPDFSGSISREINVCTLCPYKTIWKSYLTKHLLLEHPETQESPKPLSSCSQCTATFKTKRGLDDHTLRNHPHVTSTVTSKIHKCTLCPYKSSMRDQIDRHMSKHSLIKLITNEGKLNRCNQCHAVYKRKEILDHIIRKHPDFSESISGKISVCRFCPYKTTWKSYLKRHLLLKHPETQESPKPLSSCSHCTATFKSKIGLTEHTLQKHPHAASTVTSKLHKCTLCPYKTAMKRNIDRHMPKHSQTKLITNKHKLNRCNQCEAAYIRRDILDDHIIRKHPDLIASVSRKIHACKYCTYKSTISHRITKHMLKHSEATDGSTSYKIHECTICPYNTLVKSSLRRHLLWKHPETKESPKPLNTCSRCKATFKRKQSLDEHTLRKHSHVTSAVTSKIHKCTLCPYTTTMKISIDRHISKHSQIKLMANKRKLNWCNQCDAVYIKREFLDEHIIRKHPDLVDSVSRKIHACKYCTFKSTLNYRFTKHMLKHSETQESPQLPSSCRQCKATFKSKRGLDEHTLKKHPHVTSTVTSKIHKCTLCPYKTIITMEDETAANVQNMKIEVEEVKVEMAEVNIESFGIEQISWGLAVQGDHDERTDRIIDLQRIKDEHNFVEAGSNIQLPEMQGKKIKVEENWEDYKSFEPLQFTEVDTIKLEKNDDLIDGNTEITLNGIKDEHNFVEPGSNIEVPELQEKKIKLEENWEDSIPFEPMYITNEDICKIKKNDDLIDENTKTTLNSDPQQEIQRQNLEVCKRSREELYSCYNCNYTTFYKNHLIKHMKLHCITKFASKKKIDATARKSTLDKHMLEHSETKDELKICIDCHMVFKNERWLVNHRNKEHSDSVQVFKCIHCKYKTTLKSSFDRHMLKHLGTTDDHMAEPISLDWYHCKHCTYKTSLKTNFERHMLKHSKREKRCRNVCRHCGLTLMSPRYLDEHMVRKHPDSIASITRKIYECKHCSYKTCLNDRLSKHNKIQHPETVDSSKLHNCIHCGASFKCKRSMDEHIIRRHPDFIASVSSKIHACKYCTYKSTVTHSFEQHMLKHSGATDRHKYRKCTECGAVFKNKVILDDHTIRKHPHVTSTVTNKIHECTLCPYKTTKRSRLTSHMLQHYPETCSHCKETFKSKLSLTEHIVRKHPQLTSTVTTKIHECTFCPYKTTKKSHIDWHMSHSQHSHSQHSQIKLMTTEGKLKKCNHCDAVYERKESLDDHIIRKHPDLIAYISRKIHTCKYCTFKSTVSSAMTKHMSRHSDTTDGSISSKIHECTLCSYKTTFKVILTRHMLRQHPETQESPELLSSCSQCKEAFRRKQALDEHILRKHPHVTSIVTSKIHECTLCSYKTTFKVNLTRHMLRLHPETQESPELLSSCSQCKATFRSKQALDEHTLQKHPHVTSTVTSKIHECTLCPYKTSMKNHFDRHISKHSQIE